MFVRHQYRRISLQSAAVLMLSAGVLAAASGSQAAPTAVNLRTAASFVVLAGAGVTNTGSTTLNGDIGTFPTTTITGASGLTIAGTNHQGDAVTQGAKPDLVQAYDNAAGQGPTNPIAGDLGGQTLTRGVYTSGSSIGLTGALTLNAEGDPDAVFVFQAGSTLITQSASVVNLVNGAQACNVFWQVGSSATLGTASMFRGTIMALTDITLTTNARLIGRALARNGAVTLDTNTITRPACTSPTTDDDSDGDDDTDGGGGGGADDDGTGGGDDSSGDGGSQVTDVPDGSVDTGTVAPAGHDPAAWQTGALAAFGLTVVGGATLRLRRHER